MYRFLATPRWVGLTLLLIVLIPAFYFLGKWQYSRYEARSAASERISANLKADPVPLERLDRIGGSVPKENAYRRVTATGRYDPAHELVVRLRSQNGRPGFYVVTPLVTGDGAVLVNRGWVPVGATAETPPEVPPAPTGEVTVTGWLLPSETEESTGIKNLSGLPPGQIVLINTEEIGKGLPYRLYGGFVQLAEQRPAATPAPEPVPEPSVGGGGLLNLAYSLQWWLFIGIAIAGWFILARREARERRQADTAVITDRDHDRISG
ncbi:SURF1 family protein [Thermobispora bispora]|uniref:SURF1-like protein n=1 Tax=Thermobispora bispora (strain ATCC 19993 / DSM 43833 / CBS 139.67 / JCM 10125 / KCTC 9307 / NBRC 14880 / R51) TaxID=469371 RepID=D6YAF8_THEBD|nr:SURF1 family protein [Thermobispora bispora]ADG90211.1 conserved hypothetical protein [Thermobispora bispora DSM 43833]